jgi:hypothetical protein
MLTGEDMRKINIPEPDRKRHTIWLRKQLKPAQFIWLYGVHVNDSGMFSTSYPTLNEVVELDHQIMNWQTSLFADLLWIHLNSRKDKHKEKRK